MASWDREKPLSPAFLRTAVALVGGLCAVWAVVSLTLSVFAVNEGRYGPAIVQVIAGLTAPFAIWLGVRLLADIVVLQHRALERGGGRASLPATQASRASDDGPNYEAE